MLTQTRPAAMTAGMLADAFGLTAEQVKHWIRKERMTPVSQANQPTAARMYSTAEFALVVERRTPPAGWLTLKQVGAELGYGRDYVYNLYERRAFSGRMVNGLVMVDPESLRAWVAAGKPTGDGHAKRPVIRKATRRPKAEHRERDDLDGDETTPAGKSAPVCYRRTLVSFGPSGLLLYQDDLDFLARVRAKYPRRGEDREGR